MPPPLQKTPERISAIILNALAIHENQLGVNSLALILKGSKDKNIIKRKLDESLFYGALFYYPLDIIENFVKQLLEQECLQKVLRQERFYTVSFLSLTLKGKLHLEEKKDLFLERKRTLKSIIINPSIKQTLDLFHQLKNVQAVAQQRHLVPNTIYGHLEIAIQLGLLSALEVVEEEKVKLILEIKNKITFNGLKVLKEALPSEITYEEIKCVLAQEKD